MDFKTGKFVEIKTGKGGGVGGGCSRSGRSGPEKVRMVRVEDDWKGSVFGFVQDHGHRSAGVPTEPDLRSVRTLRRKEPLA